MSDPWRCPDCGCLAVAWSRAHSPTCVYGLKPADVLDAVRDISTRLDHIGKQLDTWTDLCRSPLKPPESP